MKLILKTILMAVGITAPFTFNLAAQNHRMAVDIPFTFLVNQHPMPAGHYELSQQNFSDYVFAVLDTSGHTALAPFGFREDNKAGKASLTFACYGKTCVLSKVALPDRMIYALDRKTIEKNLHHTVSMALAVPIKLAQH